MRPIHALFVDDEEQLRDNLIENLEIALSTVAGIDMTNEVALRPEDAKRLLPKGQTRFHLVVVDMLWEAVGRTKQEARGLEIVEQAAATPGVVIVAVSLGDTREFPTLREDALERGATVFCIRGALQAGTKAGAWNRLAEDIVAELDHPVNGADAIGGDEPAADATDRDPRRVFVVHGRDRNLVRSTNEFLRAIGLDPFEWERLIAMIAEEGRTGGNPNIFDVVEFGFENAFGAVVLFSPDDEVRLRSHFRSSNDPAFESLLTGQPRPNVLLEAGYALAKKTRPSLIVTVGEIRPLSNLSGRHMLYMDNTAKKRKAFAERLQALGFAVDFTSEDWLDAGDFTRPDS